MTDGAAPLLGTIRAVTHVVPDLAVIRAVYGTFLGYQPVAEGALPADAAAAWGAPAMAGRRYLTLAPACGTPVWLRFVESPTAAGWRALTTHGWNATEIVVQDVDALAVQLEGSPFQIIGPPKSLQRFPMIRAMQVLGPAGECLYLTQVGPGSGLDLARAAAFVGRVFIVVAGGPDLAAMFATYAGFANTIDPPVSTRVQVISWANGLPPEMEHAHGLVKLPSGTLVELDAYPTVTRPRATAAGELPPGMAMVSFSIDDARAFGDRPTHVALLPGGGASTCFRGAAGEWIELVGPP
ncbi:hypothetical protein UAJ10_03395 [Nitrospirillum sp. BR 11164]|uniref:hypothetical protein n=1 Tax=Nitrospirillum sp. BR 11164 TaxID=3104324 RepID=UPI002AFF6890|nr:hypothetical protein [Nitrospirillum sp. BR 11164]MEA1648064.1 hypothetical protein [Nitrospirillum sp. BR 11164]